jgi:hypothetical protein
MPLIYDVTSNSNRLEVGDILISKKSFGHAGIVKISEGTTATIIHAVNAGIKTESVIKFPNNATTYRPNNLTDGARATLVHTMNRFTLAGEERSIHYSPGRAVKNWLGRSNFDDDARKRRLKYLSYSSGLPKNVICSELVILCYQLAFEPGSQFFISKDAKHTLPNSLENYLKESHWSCMGNVRTSQ